MTHQTTPFAAKVSAKRPVREAPKRLRELLMLLAQLTKTYDELHEAIRGKLAAMRAADLRQMREWASAEARLAGRIQEREGLRRQIMESVGAEIGLSPVRSRELTISALAAHLADPERSQLLRVADALRRKVIAVSHANRVAGSATRETLAHLGHVFASVRPAQARPDSYTHLGSRPHRADAGLFETVG